MTVAEEGDYLDPLIVRLHEGKLTRLHRSPPSLKS